MWALIEKLARRLMTAAAVLVILLAIAIGGFRLLVAQLPGYQEELQAWVTDTLGLELQFARLDVRWGLRGPELTFHDAQVAGVNEREPFLSAQQATVHIDSIALLTERRVRFNQLTFDGTRLILVREADGALRLQGMSLGAADRAQWMLDLPPDVQVAVRDSEIHYLDRGRGTSWEFDDVSGTLSQIGDTMTFSARARPPAALAARAEFSAGRSLDAGNGAWRVRAELRGLDLGELARGVPAPAGLPHAGTGDLSAEVAWSDGQLTDMTMNVALQDVELGNSESDRVARYERLGVNAQWRAQAGGWRLELGDLVMSRQGRSWPAPSRAELVAEHDAGGIEAVTLRSDFLRLEDLLSMAPAGLFPAEFDDWLELAPRGDVSDLELWLRREPDGWEYTVGARFAGVETRPSERWPGVSGLSGEFRADPRSGRLRVASRDVTFDWPRLFREIITIDDLSGLFVWRQGQDGVRVVSDNLALVNADATTRSHLELSWPLAGGLPTLDLETTVTDSSVTAVRRYLPVHIMSDDLVEWLDHALAGGRIASAAVTFFGPIEAFPFDGGEGQLRASIDVEDGVLAYLQDWPVAEELNGAIEFLNASFRARGRGRVLGNASDDIDVHMADMRDPVLSIDADTAGPLSDVLAFVRGAPLIAAHAGPELERVGVHAGTGRVSMNLALPLADAAAFELSGAVRIDDGELSIDGFVARATEIRGEIEFRDSTVTARGIEAVLFDGPVSAHVDTVNLPGYRARIALEGEISARTLMRELNLPLETLVAGQTRWQGSLLLPVNVGNGGPPVHATVGSNLSGVALQLPAPFAKTAAEALSLSLDFAFADEGLMEVRGDIGATRRFALAYRDRGDGFELDRGSLRFGGGWPELPAQEGVMVDGTLPGTTRFDEWLALARASGAPPGLDAVLLGVDLAIADFSAFGQAMGPTRLNLTRGDQDWFVDIDSTPIAGRVVMPRDLGNRPQLTARMQRLQLATGGAAGLAAADPRELPGLSLQAEDFAVGMRRFGSMEAEIFAEPLGLRLASFSAAADTFAMDGSGGWFHGPQGAGTVLTFQLRSSDVAGSLEELGFERFAEGQGGEISASVRWPGPPSGDWARHVGGDLAIRVETGSLVDLQPGAGRMIGLMSITALPRRLALDFRDVFQRGLVFDEIAGDFLIRDGNAYTTNLMLTGPAVEIGVAGRTGLRDHDYQQHAVVTAEPGKMLPTVGGLLGGPGVGAALLIFTQLFREPLKGLGRVSYCVTGSWDDPLVERIGAQQTERARDCAALPPTGELSTNATEALAQ